MDPGQPFTGGPEASKCKWVIVNVRGFFNGMLRVQLVDLRTELVEITQQIPTGMRVRRLSGSPRPREARRRRRGPRVANGVPFLTSIFQKLPPTPTSKINLKGR